MAAKRMMGIILILGLSAVWIKAQDSTMKEMPPMGAPEQMKEIAFLEGFWNVDMEWRDKDNPEVWNKEKAVCSCKSVLSGCAMETKFQGTMMGMPFEGYMLDSYDRDKQQWQSIWIDNMGGKMSYYTGNKAGEKKVLVGVEMWQGQKYLSRVTTFNHTPTGYDWTIENSFDNGQTWQVEGKATYTKRK